MSYYGHSQHWRKTPTNKRARALYAVLLEHHALEYVDDVRSGILDVQGGDLLSALQSPSSDEALMKGAGAILTALIRGGPVEDITAYRDGAEATSLYLHRLASREVDLEDVNVVAAIQRYVASLRDCPDAAPPGWDERLAGIESQIEAILSRSG